MTRCDVAIVGPGPYGLSAAAHLRAVRGLDVRIFGEPMTFWTKQMPAGMFLRSPWSASSLSEPSGDLSLDAFCAQIKKEIPQPIPLDWFTEYCLWFQRQAVPDVDRRRILHVDRDENSGFHLTLSDGESCLARRVVVASGIGPFARRPIEFQDLPRELVTHSSDGRDVQRLRGKSVVVIGAGQSALESAALLHEAGARVEVVARTPQVHWLGWRARIQSLPALAKLLYSRHDVGPAGVSRIVAFPALVKWFPRSTQDWFRNRALRPAGSAWLRDRLADVRLTAGRVVVSAVPSGNELRLTLDDGTVRDVDHVLLGTGYRVDVTRYEFLKNSGLGDGLVRSNGFPILAKDFSSSIPGLHFLGAPSAWSFGPLMYFVCGTEYAARTLAKHVARDGPR